MISKFIDDRFFLILSVIAFVGKQSQKVLASNKNNKWPNIYTFDTDIIKKISS